MLNYDNGNYSSAKVVSIVLHLHHLGWILDKFILCPYCRTLNTIETRLCTQNECPIFTILGSFGGGIDLQIKSTLISHGCFIFMDVEKIEVCGNCSVVSTMLGNHWCRQFIISASVISARRLNRHQWNMISLSIWFLFPCHNLN